MQSDIEVVINASKRLEALLEQRLGATGRGLHEKVSSVEQRLDVQVARDLRFLATVRNQLVHEGDRHGLDDRQRFEEVVERCAEALSQCHLEQSTETTPAELDPRWRADRRGGGYGGGGRGGGYGGGGGGHRGLTTGGGSTLPSPKPIAVPSCDPLRFREIIRVALVVSVVFSVGTFVINLGSVPFGSTLPFGFVLFVSLVSAIVTFPLAIVVCAVVFVLGPNVVGIGGLLILFVVVCWLVTT